MCRSGRAPHPRHRTTRQTRISNRMRPASFRVIESFMRFRVRGTGDRADKALLDALRSERPEISRARVRELFQTGAVLLRGHAIEAARALPPGEHEIEIDPGMLESTLEPR